MLASGSCARLFPNTSAVKSDNTCASPEVDLLSGACREGQCVESGPWRGAWPVCLLQTQGAALASASVIVTSSYSGIKAKSDAAGDSVLIIPKIGNLPPFLLAKGANLLETLYKLVLGVRKPRELL